MGNDPELRNDIAFYEMTPHEQQEDLWKKANVLLKKHNKHFFVEPCLQDPFTNWLGYFAGLFPGISSHVTMFRLSVENLGNAE